jgi:hypothetical protein
MQEAAPDDRCLTCDGLIGWPRKVHCDSPSCPWVECPNCLIWVGVKPHD